MSFLQPLGFLALLAIPLLVAIYIIKSKYTEQVIPSTYLWALSEKFLKRKNPVSRITGIISLVLQILAVILISLAVAHPVFTLKGRAEDYLFVLDCSGSMNVVQSNGETRFNNGKSYIKEVITSSAAGSTYTFITASETVETYSYRATEGSEQYSEVKKQALAGLDRITCSYVGAPLGDALAAAQNHFTQNPACSVYLVTDRQVEEYENVTVKTLQEGESNFALSDVSYEFTSGGVTVSGKVISYGESATLTVQAFEDGAAAPSAELQIPVEGGTANGFQLNWQQSDFTTLRVCIKEEDSLAADDGVYLYNSRHDQSYNTLIVSDAPFFFESALASLGNVRRSSVTTEQYSEGQYEGYGLYIFDSFVPEKLPKDGAVWFVNPVGSVGEAGFTVGGKEELGGVQKLSYNKATSSKVQNLLSGYDPNEEVSVISYVKCNLYRNFTTLMSYRGSPVLFAGSDEYGNREVVFAFDFHESDFVLSYNYMVLLNNLVSYTFPSVVDDGSHYCGDGVTVNILAGCTSVRVDTPEGKTDYIDTSSETGEYRLISAGEYKITAVVNGDIRVNYLFAQLPEEERIISASQPSFSLVGEADGSKRDGVFEDVLYLFVILAVIVVADWAVYCYEQYQLR